MDYVLGSVAALVTGNVTPNRPRLMKRALTPTKHQPSPNVTPKSEFVEDRSIFLSPSMQKKKAIVKKSPKRIFQNPDLETTDNGEGNLSLTSPKADKVKKHLKDELESGSVAITSATESIKSPKKGKKKRDSITPETANNSITEQNANEMTPKKKKSKPNSVSESAEQTPSKVSITDINTSVAKSPKKMKVRRKSVMDNDSNKENDATENPPETSTNITQTNQKPTDETVNNTTKKKNKKRKKKPKTQTNQESTKSETKANSTVENQDTNTEKTQTNQEANNGNKKKKNKKHKNKGKQPLVPPTPKVSEDAKSESTENITEDVKTENVVANKNRKRKNSKSQPEAMEINEPAVESDETDESETQSKKSKTTVNPNAITDKESDSEHDSDDEIESENEEINKSVFESEQKDESSDEEEEQKESEPEKKKVEKKKEVEDKTEVDTEEEIKRTLFVGNVPFSAKCKKEIKKIFNKHGQIETIRIRTVPVKDGRYTPKLAVIKNELHPERTTVNVYIKYKEEESVEKALSENNTVLNDHHLRVSRSSHSGAEHDPKCSIFVGNLPFAMEDEALRQKFENCGEIESVRIIRDKKTNAGKGFGYVNYASKDGVELALALTEEDLTIKNRIIRVKRCTLLTNKQKQDNNKPGSKKQFNQRPNQEHRVQRPQQGGNRLNQGGNRPNQGGNRPYQGGNRPYQGGNRPNQGGNRPNQGGNRPNQGNRPYQGGQRSFQGGSRPNQGGQRFQDGQNGFQGGQKSFQGGNDGEGRDGAHRRIMNKRKNQEVTNSEGPPNKKQKNITQPNKEKKSRKEFVGMTAEKKKKRKFDKGQKKKKALSEILTK